MLVVYLDSGVSAGLLLRSTDADNEDGTRKLKPTGHGGGCTFRWTPGEGNVPTSRVSITAGRGWRPGRKRRAAAHDAFMRSAGRGCVDGR